MATETSYVQYAKPLWKDEDGKNDPDGGSSTSYTPVKDQGYNGSDGKKGLRIELGEVAEVSAETHERLLGRFPKGTFVTATEKDYAAQLDGKRKAQEKRAREADRPDKENRALVR